jgi:phosphomannomutase
VIAAMEQAGKGPVAGYEANGGFLLGTDITWNGRRLAALKTRDALLPMILLLSAAWNKRCRVSELVAGLPQRYTFSDRLQNVNIPACSALLAKLSGDPSGFARLAGTERQTVVALDTMDGVRATLGSGDILHLRLSGNAPELRCYAEAATPERAARLCSDCLTLLGKDVSIG